MPADLVDQYETQVELEYRGEKYAVRDNGAICRLSKPGRRRKHDGVWTFGSPGSNGYMQVGSHVVHRIVALAFHKQPTEHHVVDHIDTNRLNNRADNLRWVTRLENILLNEITRARVIRSYGSLAAFFENPSAVRELDQNLSWMRTVSKEEAEVSRRRLLEWAKSDKPTRGRLGDWIFRPTRARGGGAGEAARDIQSASPMAIQRGWRTPTEFPACPDSIGSDPLGDYLERLKPETIFSRSISGETITEVAGRTADIVAVVGRMPGGGVKGWGLAAITVEDGNFVHQSKGSYFSREGAINAFCRLIGTDPPYASTIDDFC